MDIARCFCCGREIAEGDVCSDCMRAVVDFVEPRTTVMDVLAEFDLTPEQAKIVLGAVAGWPEKRHVPRYMPIPESVVRAVDRLPPLPEDEDNESEAAMLAELDRLRDGIGTNDKLADYAAAREMIQDEGE